MLDSETKRHRIRCGTNPWRAIKFRFHIGLHRDFSYSLVSLQYSTMPLDQSFLEALQSKTARTTITSSSMRGPGCGAAIRVARAFTRELSLERFSSRSRIGFARELDAATGELFDAMPRGVRAWGLARKGLNIFLRECLYTSFLRDAYRLQRSENYLELPLDSLTGTALKKIDASLPRWDSVRRLTPEISARFQQVARWEGKRRRLAAVHLDVFWWGHRGVDG